ncbi:MAG TPA: hypothetical protein VJN19_04955 [Propionibacteriaceae bacterium]|nr:hypothetical protein [Propionibacteriaceae bacterium]
MTIHSSAAEDDETADANSGGVDTERRITSPHHRFGSAMLSLCRRWPGTVAAGSIAVLFAAAYLLAAPMGRDLSAQLAHAQLADHWPELLNLRWYGGFNPLGYSVLSPPVMALLGVRLSTAVAYVTSVVLFAALLQRTGVARPVAGALTGAVCFTGNLVVTRTTFALALAMALGALLALVSGRLRISSMVSVLAALTSPVAGLFLGVAGGALFLSDRRREGVLLGVSGLMPTVAIGLAFGNGGYQTFGTKQALMGLLGCLAVAGLCWRRPVIRWGSLLSAGLVAAAYAMKTPVGTTATRLPELFAAPILVAVAAVPLIAVIAAAASVVLLLPWSSITEVQERGDPALSAEFYAPLLDQLASRGVAGPIEVVPTLRRGEAAIVAPVVPIARGWSRQLDTGRHPIFYNGSLNADAYRQWLDDNAISHVALSNGPYDWAAPKEAALVRGGLPYLQEAWSNSTWTLYAVENPRPVISTPGRVIGRDGVSLTVSLPEAGEYLVRVHWSRYLSTSAGCMRPAEGGWTTLVVEQPGTAKIKGSLLPRHC